MLLFSLKNGSMLLISILNSHDKKRLVVTYWERADPLALKLFVMFNCVYVTFHGVSWVRCGT